MDITQLEYFISVARFLNFSKAAEDCHVTQATISKHIARLEKELDAPLFERDTHEVHITEAGKMLALYAPVFLEYHNSIISRVQNAPHGVNKTIRIGLGPMECLLLREPLKLFHQRFPNILIDLTTYTYHVLLTRYRNGVLDLAICNELCANDMDSFIRKPIYNAPWQVVAGKTCSFWTLPHKQQKMLHNQMLITQIQDAYDPVHAFCIHNSMEQRSLLATNFLCTQLDMIQANLGIALLPPFVKDTLPDCLCMKDILEESLAPQFCAAYNPATVTPEILELIRLCDQTGQ